MSNVKGHQTADRDTQSMAIESNAMDQLSKSITVNGRRTSIRMERSIWHALDEVSAREQCRVRDLIALIDRSRGENGLTAALRVFVVNYLRSLLGSNQQIAPVPPKPVTSPLVASVIRTITED